MDEDEENIFFQVDFSFLSFLGVFGISAPSTLSSVSSSALGPLLSLSAGSVSSLSTWYGAKYPSPFGLKYSMSYNWEGLTRMVMVPAFSGSSVDGWMSGIVVGCPFPLRSWCGGMLQHPNSCFACLTLKRRPSHSYSSSTGSPSMRHAEWLVAEKVGLLLRYDISRGIVGE